MLCDIYSVDNSNMITECTCDTVFFYNSATQLPTLPLPPVLTISAGFEDQDVRDGLVAGCGQHDRLHVRRIFGPGLQIGNQCCDVCA